MLDMFRNENFQTQVTFPRWHCDELFQPSHSFSQYIFDHHIAAKYFSFVTASFLILDKKLNLCDSFARGASESTAETLEFFKPFWNCCDSTKS